MKEESHKMSLEDAWKVLKKHFIEDDGLLDQIDHGRKVIVRLGDQPEECQELQAIQESLDIIHRSWDGMNTLPKAQVCQLWKVVPRLQDMLKRSSDPFTIHVIHAKILTWIDHALNDIDPKSNPEILIVHDIVMHMKGLQGFSNELRFGRIDLTTFEELVLAITVLHMAWRNRSTIPRLAVRLLLFIPLMSWNASIYTQEQRKQLESMKQLLYNLIEACFCEA